MPVLGAEQRQGNALALKGQPLTISEGKWGAKQTIVLKNDEKLWHKSWSRYPDKPASLDEVLATCDSYGFSFVGFSERSDRQVFDGRAGDRVRGVDEVDAG